MAGPSSQQEDEGGDDLTTFEREAARDASADKTTTTTTKRRNPKADTSREDAWMARMMEYMDTNNKLLERLSQDKQPESPKSAFITYLSKWLRAAPEHQFQELMTINLDRINAFSRTSSAPPGPPTPAPPLPPTTPQPAPFFPFPGMQWPSAGYQLPLPPQLSTPVRMRRESSTDYSSFLGGLQDLSFGAPPGPAATQVAPPEPAAATATLQTPPGIAAETRTRQQEDED